jgi:hypothetical protein
MCDQEGCSVLMHPTCAGLLGVPSGDWFCAGHSGRSSGGGVQGGVDVGRSKSARSAARGQHAAAVLAAAARGQAANAVAAAGAPAAASEDEATVSDGEKTNTDTEATQ